MRDPKRIDVVLKQLRDYWIEHPDLRLCQIVTNLASKSGFGPCIAPNIYYLEDEAFINLIKEEIEKSNNLNSSDS